MNNNFKRNEATESRKETVANLIDDFLKNESVMKYLGFNYDELSEDDKNEIINDMLTKIKDIEPSKGCSLSNNKERSYGYVET